MYLDVTLHIAPLPGWGGSAGVGLMTVEHGSEAKNRTLDTSPDCEDTGHKLLFDTQSISDISHLV